MRVALLGELSVRADDGADLLVTGAKQRALLAVLALHAGRPVATDRLVDALWGDDPPPAVRNGLQGLVSKLRRSLRSTDLVAMRGGGYALELPPDAIDVHRFEHLVGQGRATAADGELAGAIALLVEAEALWRGDALAEFTYEEFASVAISRLSELRIAAIEERLDAELQLGRHQGVIGELEVLVASHPLRERPRGLLMIALYRAGRQADALRIYREGRVLLGEELGLDPGPELRQMEAAILAHDPSLASPAVGDAGSSWRPHHSSVPASLTPLVGRDEELRDLTRLFDDHRLVTLVGPGGVGKTRLAIEVARVKAPTLTDGACLVELAPVGDPAGVPAAITAALDLPDPNVLAEMIGDRDLLIILDNCEHVISTAAQVAEDLLRRCPGLRLLATSREGLRVGGELIWPVPPLAAGDAAQLFVVRAQAAGGHVDVSDAEQRDAVSDICDRLDGLPLAIELAAARTRAFPVQQLLSRLNDRFRLLTGGSRTALPRQQTLRAVVDWSYELLFDDEQRIFERLSVFPGGCDLSTAQAVCGDERLAAPDIEDIIHALVDKSLVSAVQAAGEVRFTQLQTLAQYGREKLAERGDSAQIRDAMAAHYARLCGQSAAAYIGDHQRTWLTAIDHEQDNLRGALEWAAANDDAETALMIAGGASWPHWLAGTTIEGKRWLDAAFACAGDAAETTRALALTGRGLIDFQLGEHDRVDADLEAALAVFRAHDDVASVTLAQSFWAEVAATRGDFDEARRRRRAVLAFYMALPDDPFVTAGRAYSQAKLGLLDGDLARAERWYRQAAEGFGLIDRPMMRSMCLDVVADFEERSGNYRAAVEALEEAVETNDAIGLRGFMGFLLARLAWALLHDGNTGRAELMYQRALDVARRLRNAPVVAMALTGLAVVHRLSGHDRDASTAAIEALELSVPDGPRRLANRVDPQADMLIATAACCCVLGCVAADAGDGERAAHLLGRADRLRTDAGKPMPPLVREDERRAREAAVALLGHDAFAAAFDRGQRGRHGGELVLRA